MDQVLWLDTYDGSRITCKVEPLVNYTFTAAASYSEEYKRDMCCALLYCPSWELSLLTLTDETDLYVLYELTLSVARKQLKYIMCKR